MNGGKNGGKPLYNLETALFNIAAESWEDAKKFYGETLGIPVAFDLDEMGWIAFGEENKIKLDINRIEGDAHDDS